MDIIHKHDNRKKKITDLVLSSNSTPFLSPGHTSSPLNTRGTSTFSSALEGALMNVTLRTASVPECRCS